MNNFFSKKTAGAYLEGAEPAPPTKCSKRITFHGFFHLYREQKFMLSYTKRLQKSYRGFASGPYWGTLTPYFTPLTWNPEYALEQYSKQLYCWRICFFSLMEGRVIKYTQLGYQWHRGGGQGCNCPPSILVCRKIVLEKASTGRAFSPINLERKTWLDWAEQSCISVRFEVHYFFI